MTDDKTGDKTRRDFIQLVAAGSATFGVMGAGAIITTPLSSLANDSHPAPDKWDQGDLVHLLPTVNHRRILIKASFNAPQTSTPSLRVKGRTITGVQNDSYGFFWQFDVDGLTPRTKYKLQLVDADNRPLCDPWPLTTFPHPDDTVKRLKILTYTCGGGDETLVQSDGVAIFNTIEARRALLKRGLSFNPDIVIANGDQIYYDERTMTQHKPPLVIKAWESLFTEVGMFDRTRHILGTANEKILKNIGDRQIAHLYGVMLRSTPVFMLTDDHDLFDNDEARKDLITLPADAHQREAARATQRLYYPEFLPDENRPQDLPGGVGPHLGKGLSESFGTLRYGTLFEALMYDTKRYVSIKGDDAYMCPLSVETWLKQRTEASDTVHLAHIPSTPIGWSAGKWGEWYPDILEDNDKLGTSKPKPYWPNGWWLQHQRLLKMIGGQQHRTPVIMSGDLHMFSAGKIMRSGELTFDSNPIHSLVVGPLGTGTPAFPSAARGVLPQSPSEMVVEEYVSPLEKNGFTIVDVTSDQISAQYFAWRPPEPVRIISNLEPVHQFTIPGGKI